jgi:hypothetical protein
VGGISETATFSERRECIESEHVFPGSIGSYCVDEKIGQDFGKPYDAVIVFAFRYDQT